MANKTPFKDSLRYLSNFHNARIVFMHAGTLRVASSTEHAYQAFRFTDETIVTMILAARTPREAKRIARQLKDKMRPDWHDIKVDTMLFLTRQKFKAHRQERGKLLFHLKTFSEFVEWNHWHDNFWGNCSCSGCKNIEGANMLGKILTHVAKELRDGKERSFIYA